MSMSGVLAFYLVLGISYAIKVRVWGPPMTDQHLLSYALIAACWPYFFWQWER